MPFEFGSAVQVLETRRFLNDLSNEPHVRMNVRERICLALHREFEITPKWQRECWPVYNDQGIPELVCMSRPSTRAVELAIAGQMMGCKWAETGWDEILAAKPKLIRETLSVTDKPKA